MESNDRGIEYCNPKSTGIQREMPESYHGIAQVKVQAQAQPGTAPALAQAQPRPLGRHRANQTSRAHQRRANGPRAARRVTRI